MRRGRGKAKKQTVVSSHEDPVSGEDEKIPAYRRRGRPQKQSKDEVEEEEDEAQKKMEEDDEDVKGSEMKNQAALENGRKRKRSMLAKENIDSVKKENVITTNSNTNDSTKFVGYRQNGSRRKNKPRRAAEAVVECK